MKKLILISLALCAFELAGAQTDSTMTTQLNRQVQNKSTMNKSSGNTQSPSTARVQNTRKARKMVSTTSRGTIKTEPDKTITTVPVIQGSGTMPNNENTNTIAPSVINGNKDSQDAGTKVPSP